MQQHLGSAGGTPLYDLPAQITPLTAARGTILVLDWRALHSLGVYAAYEAALLPARRDELLAVTAGSWVPLELLFVHYRALDGLDLHEEAVRSVGRAVGEGVHGAFLSTLVRLAGKLGVSPWLALEQCYKLWVRSWRGGAITVHRMSDGIAHVGLIDVPICRSRFFCISMSAAICASIAPFGREPMAREVPGSRAHDSVLIRVSWQR